VLAAHAPTGPGHQDHAAVEPQLVRPRQRLSPPVA
jgi:hypothetical protein